MPAGDPSGCSLLRMYSTRIYKGPIMPGKKGTIKVTYNGTGKYPGHFKKSITLRTNAKTEMVRLYIEGDMTSKRCKVGKNRLLHKGESFGSPFFCLL